MTGPSNREEVLTSERKTMLENLADFKTNLTPDPPTMSKDVWRDNYQLLQKWLRNNDNRYPSVFSNNQEELKLAEWLSIQVKSYTCATKCEKIEESSWESLWGTFLCCGNGD